MKAVSTNSNREKALELALASIEKQFGKGAIMKLGEGGAIMKEISVIPTGANVARFTVAMKKTRDKSYGRFR